MVNTITMEMFEASLPANKVRARNTFISMSAFFLLSIAGIILSAHYWDQYTYQVTTLTGKVRTRGWPVTVSSWSYGMAVVIPLTMVLFYFLTDRKKPSLAVSREGLFINQQLMRAVTIPWENIRQFRKTDNGSQPVIEVQFHDNEAVVQLQKGLAKAFVKSNLSREGGIRISSVYSTGDFNAFYECARKYVRSIS